MKKLIIGVVCGILLGMSGSVFAITGSFLSASPIKNLTLAEEIKAGHTFSIYTGKKLEMPIVSLSVEERLAKIEARLSKLENK